MKISLDVLFFHIVALLIIALSSIAVNLVVTSSRVRPKSIDTHLMRVSLRIVMLVLIALVILHVTSNIGIPITPVLAGLGVGGLAVALAAQSTIENVIGGLHSVRRPACAGRRVLPLRRHVGYGRGDRPALDPHPHARANGGHGAECRIFQDGARELQPARSNAAPHHVGLRYETTPEQLRRVLAELYELLQTHPKVVDDPIWVRFAGFGAYSLDIEFFAYVGSADRLEFLAVREEIYLRIMDLIDEAGTGFAFPSQTHYLVQDPVCSARPHRRPGGGAGVVAAGFCPGRRAPAEGATSRERTAAKR